jgi:3-methyladenine DNA glycosylase/8-oxoguanine DNA glycosylase
MHKIAEPWKEYASIASWYLWREMDGMKAAPKKPSKKIAKKKSGPKK